MPFERFHTIKREKALKKLASQPGHERAAPIVNSLLPLLQQVDAWRHLPDDFRFTNPYGNLKQALNLARNNCRSVLKNVETNPLAPPDIQRVNQQIATIQQSLNQLSQATFIAKAFENSATLEGARKLVTLIASISAELAGVDEGLKETVAQFNENAEKAYAELNTRADRISKALAEALKSMHDDLKKRIADTDALFKDVLSEASLYKEKTKQQFEESQEYFQNQAMTAFGSAFDEEARLAEKKAERAGLWAFLCVLFLVGGAGFFVAVQMGVLESWIPRVQSQPERTVGESVHWSLLRISVLGFLAWFVGHYFRERKNFLHVGVANRHRRNLCNAYIAVSQKMTSEERQTYLATILPELSTLGKTGFIAKEEVIEHAGLQTIKTLLDTVTKTANPTK